MGGGNMGVVEAGPVSGAPPMGIRTPSIVRIYILNLDSSN